LELVGLSGRLERIEALGAEVGHRRFITNIDSKLKLKLCMEPQSGFQKKG